MQTHTSVKDCEFFRGKNVTHKFNSVRLKNIAWIAFILNAEGFIYIYMNRSLLWIKIVDPKMLTIFHSSKIIIFKAIHFIRWLHSMANKLWIVDGMGVRSYEMANLSTWIVYGRASKCMCLLNAYGNRGNSLGILHKWNHFKTINWNQCLPRSEQKKSA